MSSRLYQFLIRTVDKHVPPRMQPFWNHEAGPKTIFFWAPLVKWPTDLLKKIFEHFTMECKQGRVKNIKNPLKRLSLATGISENTLKRKVMQDPVDMVVEDLQVPAPKKKPGPDRKLDDFDADLVKRTIHDMQLKGQYVSLRQLSDVLVEKGVRLFKSSLGRLVKDLGFRFYKAGSNQRYIGDRNDIVLVGAGIGDLTRPAENVSLFQSTSMLSGYIWTRWCFLIHPKNLNLALINFLVAVNGTIQCVRVIRYKKSVGKPISFWE